MQEGVLLVRWHSGAGWDRASAACALHGGARHSAHFHEFEGVVVDVEVAVEFHLSSIG